MKLFIFLISLFGAINTSTSQTLNVPFQKKPLLIKTTATWCTPCGEYLWVTDSIHSTYSDSIVFINAHVSSSTIGDPYSGDFHNEINGGGGIPAYNVDGTKIQDWPPSVNSIMDFANAQFDSTIVANIAFNAVFTGNSVTVSTTTKFFENATGEFYVNVFLLENELVADQSTSTGYQSVVHERVSRGPIMDGNSGMWGELIEASSATSGSTYDVSFTSNINPSWNTNHMEVVAVIWQKNGSFYKVLNSEDKDALTVSLSQNAGLSRLNAYPNPTTNDITIDGIKGEQEYNLIDLSGKVVLNGTLSETMNTISLIALPKGSYHLRIKNEEGISIQQIVVQ